MESIANFDKATTEEIKQEESDLHKDIEEYCIG